MDLNRLTIRDIDICGKRILVRVDYNVPLAEDGSVSDDLRIRASIPTIRYLLNGGASIILMSHLGRPKGMHNPVLSLRPVAERLSELIAHTVRMAPDCIGDETTRLARELSPGEILLLENLRFHKAETENDQIFARQLADLGDLYVNDAFGTAHRAHASTVGVPGILGSGVAGLLMERELEFFHHLLAEPARPFLAILGGAKVSGKIEVLRNLLDIADSVFVGGAMANTFFLALGHSVGDSLCELDAVDIAKDILDRAAKSGTQFLLPVDLVVAREIDSSAEHMISAADDVPDGFKALDIGVSSIAALGAACSAAQTIFWNGPMGVFEQPPFDHGTVEAARLLADATERGAVTVVGGGDSAAALRKAGCADKISHLSTGGGASLELVEGRALPGIEALRRSTT